MSLHSRPDHLMPDLDPFEKMNQDLTRMMPKEMASAVNLLAHPVAGAAAMSALGFGLANHAFGVWMGALSGAAEASQRLFQPIVDDFEARVERFSETGTNSSTKARAATKTLIAEAQSFARDVTDIAATATGDAPNVADASTVAGAAPTGLMPEDFKQPKAMDRPANPADLKAISGIGPKLEKVLNGLGIWTYGQIAAWTPEEIAWVDDYLSFNGRIDRDDWLGQAAALAEAKH
ncbi:MAG: NADH-ubiquinone dehydrogenase [Mesorhizobium sp.]|uniref:NADH-ubiquinone dehydrogenase n=1 Tax=Mesorhizobium mediterraneum TaxID=43617 RepID=A0AB36RFJ2_9HYPH|nr:MULTISPECIES: NADH-ubiquinone dehydrogenase [Mesorhizobium]AZO67740.1 NADH-ubiquinone dehydrogenase [Mesorhizobium sp. M6A.T.Cr.TU.016.01.1.1]PAQ03489.1 NADH-ubiquinone dehydrogenase [Mesorhizobium mediterraneum]RUU43853.1 NADH-ubiquinone dehydrogenase [Mesorhizobium sp. M6A.T.Ce.TU.002.03.1.1]RVB74262.1 NADH-ubiquinone dehydrogenase [Mesorhizobium sp. M6A.T.Cr.TU.014.01.1.1]RWN38990.1 MAG: NADH-ubiquinone dehydrogenase [Mesorhizobium sp.]